MKANPCAVCAKPLPLDTTCGERAEAEHYFGADPIEKPDEYAQVCPACFAQLAVCPPCGWRGLAPVDLCPRCLSTDLRRGRRCLQHDKDHGIIGDGTVRWPT